METRLWFNTVKPHNLRSYRTYEEWKPGGKGAAKSVRQVLTVPMRNGNSGYATGSNLIVGSYRTYEEWKLKCQILMKDSMFGSYRTYEEWKLGISPVDL